MTAHGRGHAVAHSRRSLGRAIAHSRPWLGREEARAAARVVRSGQLAQGREVAALEQEFAARFGFRHAVAVSSGTAALHLALLALGVGRGGRVLLPSYVCVAVLNAIRCAGGRERLIDCAPGGFQIDAGAALSARRSARIAVVPHLFGHAAPVEPLAAAGIEVIEDCAMALGARGPGRRALGRRGRLATFSFYATKAVAGGEGGMVATDDAGLAAEVRDRRSYDKKDDWRLRFNYKLTDLQAAVIRVQLARLEAATGRRQRIAATYRAGLDPQRFWLPPAAAGASWFRFVVRWPGGYEPAAARFAAHGIDVARPVHRPIHALLGLPAGRFPEAEDRFLTAISLPIYPGLPTRDLRRIIEVANRL